MRKTFHPGGAQHRTLCQFYESHDSRSMNPPGEDDWVKPSFGFALSSPSK